MFAFSRNCSDGSKSRSSCKTRFVVSNWSTILPSLLARIGTNAYAGMVARMSGSRAVGKEMRTRSTALRCTAATPRLPDCADCPTTKKWPGGWGPRRPGKGKRGCTLISQCLCQDLSHRAGEPDFRPSQQPKTDAAHDEQ